MRELSTYNAEPEELICVTAHHLREPAGVIATYTQMLAKVLLNKLDEEFRIQRQFIGDSATKLAALNRDPPAYKVAGRHDQRRADLQDVRAPERPP